MMTVLYLSYLIRARVKNYLLKLQWRLEISANLLVVIRLLHGAAMEVRAAKCLVQCSQNFSKWCLSYTNNRLAYILIVALANLSPRRVQ